MTAAPTPPPRPIAADWLALRRGPDERARAASAGLLTALTRWLGARDQPGSAPLSVVDIGAGTGANRAYLAPRLPFPTTWVLLDHDPALLGDDGNDGCRRVVGGIDELPGLLAEPGPGARLRPGAGLVTCSALLDLLTAAELDALVTAIVAAGVPAWFALTVTGVVRIEPADEADALVGTAFDAHQSRLDRPGPGAAAHLTAAARHAGLTVEVADTPWVVAAHGSDDQTGSSQFLSRYLTDRAAAAAEHLQGLGRAGVDRPTPGDGTADQVAAWLQRRLAQVEEGRLRLRVDHVDVLLLPH